MSDVIEHLKTQMADDSVNGVKVHVLGLQMKVYKKAKFDILFLDDGIVFQEKSGKLHNVFPVASAWFEVDK